MSKSMKSFASLFQTPKFQFTPKATAMRSIAFLKLFAIAVFYPVFAEASDQIPGKPQEKPIAIVGATIHPIAGETIERGVIVFEKGVIAGIGETATLPDGCVVVQADGKHVYPSLIEAYSDIGLVEINSVRASVDSREVGEFNPNVRAAAAFNPDSELIPVNRANGILLAVTAPGGGRIAGRSSMMMLDGWTWEDMTLKADVGMHVSWTNRQDELQELKQLLGQARRYMSARQAGDQPMDLRLEALQPVLSGKIPWVVDADSPEEIRSAVAFAVAENLRLIVKGGPGAIECAELLVAQKVPVIVSGVYRTPRRRHHPYDGPYALPGNLERAGIEFCISAGGRFGASGIRNLPYHVGTAVAYGLSEKAALESITLNPARILGIADRVGSLVTGLDATLILTDGNILETPTKVELAFIQGRAVDLNNKHKQLYRKYTEKYERQSE
ncbi:MAG: amidohydrolase family protein [Planctomycetota bacterium]